MIAVRRVLAPTDFSDNAAPAVRYAAGLAEKFGAELVLLHVVPDAVLVLPDAVMPTPVPGPDLTELAASARSGLARV
ncbi:MAG: universal stress protein, partial [Gemmataceae bacterium]|nr:universal stress protein [Gemmataceae bacterium]